MEEALQALLALPLRHLVEIRVEQQILHHGEVRIQAEPLRHVGDVVLHLLRILRHADAVQHGVTGAGTENRCQHAKRGRLAGPVRSHEAEELAGRDLEIQTVHSDQVVETPRQTLDPDRGHPIVRHPASSSRTSAGIPGLRSSCRSSAIRTLTA